MRYVCNFSCGAASAVATKLTLSEQSNVVIVNAFIQEEHEDNRRFEGDGNMADEPSFSCSHLCEAAERSIAGDGE